MSSKPGWEQDQFSNWVSISIKSRPVITGTGTRTVNRISKIKSIILKQRSRKENEYSHTKKDTGSIRLREKASEERTKEEEKTENPKLDGTIIS